jgi:hypothetical protein
MARPGKGKRVLLGEWQGRLDAGKSFRKAGQDLLALSEESSAGNPIIAQAVLAAIAYGDALTVKFGRFQNTVDHAALPKAVRSVLGTRFPQLQSSRLSRLLAWKDASQCGHRMASAGEARVVMEQLDRFADWAEQELTRA